ITYVAADAVALSAEVQRHPVRLAVTLTLLSLTLLIIGIPAQGIARGKARVLVAEIHPGQGVVEFAGRIPMGHDEANVRLTQHIGRGTGHEHRLSADPTWSPCRTASAPTFQAPLRPVSFTPASMSTGVPARLKPMRRE